MAFLELHNAGGNGRDDGKESSTTALRRCVSQQKTVHLTKETESIVLRSQLTDAANETKLLQAKGMSAGQLIPVSASPNDACAPFITTGKRQLN
jgi:hypothetical protein